jgi:hypothetical protein
MRRIAVTGIVLLALFAVAAATAKNPRAERERLRPADMKAAQASVVRLGDLVGGWKADPKTFADDNDDDFDCPGTAKIDVSRFVITGKAEASYTHAASAWIHTETQIMASRAHAVADFREGARAFSAKCLRYAFEHEFGKPDPNVDIAIGRLMKVRGARYGERSLRFKVDATMSGPGGTLLMYNDFLVFQKGRAIGFVYTASFKRPIDASPTLARLMLSRMR